MSQIFRLIKVIPKYIKIREMNPFPCLRFLNEETMYYAQKLWKMPLMISTIGDENILNRIIWHSIKGYDVGRIQFWPNNKDK